METKSKLVFFIKIILIYLSFLCLIVSFNFLVHIGGVLNATNATAIAGVFFLAVFLFILIINTLFFIRKKTTKDFTPVLLYNSIFCLFSGIGLRLPGFVLTNNLGVDFSVVWLKVAAGYSYFIHYDTFHFVVEFQTGNANNEHVVGIQINLVMWTLAFFLIFCYRKIHKLSLDAK